MKDNVQPWSLIQGLADINSSAPIPIHSNSANSPFLPTQPLPPRKFCYHPLPAYLSTLSALRLGPITLQNSFGRISLTYFHADSLWTLNPPISARFLTLLPIWPKQRIRSGAELRISCILVKMAPKMTRLPSAATYHSPYIFLLFSKSLALSIQTS